MIFCVFCGEVQICNGFLLLQKNEYDTISKECDKVSSKIYQVDISKLVVSNNLWKNKVQEKDLMDLENCRYF